MGNTKKVDKKNIGHKYLVKYVAMSANSEVIKFICHLIAGGILGLLMHKSWLFFSKSKTESITFGLVMYIIFGVFSGMYAYFKEKISFAYGRKHEAECVTKGTKSTQKKDKDDA